MNKFGIVLGVAAVVTLAGCKDPEYQHATGTSTQGEVKNADTTATPVTPTPTPTSSSAITIDATPVTPKCMCAPGTKHTSPCMCGDPDCKCVVETKPVRVADMTAPEPEYTTYVVQSGDYLAKISKKFNVTISSIKRLNPSIKKDVIRVGQKLKIPGKGSVGVQAASEKSVPATGVSATVATAPVAPVAAAGVKPAKKAATAYTGATKEYVVKNGDTLGSIAYGNGINIRQLKSLNGLTADTLKVGQKLKVPAAKVAAPAKTAAVQGGSVAAQPVAKAASPAVVAEKAPAAPVQAPADDDVKMSAPVEAPVAAAPAAPEKVEKPAAQTTNYVVQEGDDMTGVSIRWGVSAADIRELNNLGENDQLVPGQIIKLPADAQQ